MHFLTHRCRTAELMDEDAADERSLRASLRFIARVNALFGYTRATLAHLDRFSRSWRSGETVWMLDLATGSADIPRAILRWADRRGHDVRIVAVDRHPLTIRVAAEGPPDPRLQLLQADVFALPFPPASFDYVLTNMFLHHLDDDEIVRVLRTMDRLASRGLIAADILRHRRAYLWIKLFTTFSARMVRHDATASVAQALTRDEVLALRARASIDYAAYHRHFAHRFTLAGEKRGGEGG